MAVSEEELLTRLERGEKVESEDEMSEGYRENLVHLMTMQADSELAGAFGYVKWIMQAPGTAEKLAVSKIVKDEVRHARVMYKLLANLGVDVEKRVDSFDFSLRVEDDTDLGTSRAADDARVNIFYYPIDSWYDFIMFNVLMDRGAGHQLQDAVDCSYAPWCRVMEGIMREEDMHIAHGDANLIRFARNPEHKEGVQDALNRWYPRVMNIFGRPNSRRNKAYRKYGLKERDNHEVRMTFAAEVKELVERAGLELPHWEPDWDNIAEEAHIPG